MIYLKLNGHIKREPSMLLKINSEVINYYQLINIIFTITQNLLLWFGPFHFKTFKNLLIESAFVRSNKKVCKRATDFYDSMTLHIN